MYHACISEMMYLEFLKKGEKLLEKLQKKKRKLQILEDSTLFAEHRL